MQKGNYTITLSDGKTIPIRFTTWVFRKFSESKGLSVDQLFDYITGGLLKTEDMISMMLIGAEYVALSDKQEFAYTDFDACNWLDDMGGLTGKQLEEMIYVFLGALVNKEVTEVKSMVEVEQQKRADEEKAKKNGQEEKKSGRVGSRYIRTQPKQG